MIGFRVRGLEEFLSRIDTMEVDSDQVVLRIVSMVESQTRARIEDGGPAPDGSPWPPWSPDYALTRHANHSLLRDTNAMLDSIEGKLTGKGEGVVGAYTVYAASHNYGDGKRGIPRRQFIGLSDDDAGEIRDVLEDYILAQVDGGGGSGGARKSKGGAKRARRARSGGARTGGGAAIASILKALQ